MASAVASGADSTRAIAVVKVLGLVRVTLPMVVGEEGRQGRGGRSHRDVVLALDSEENLGDLDVERDGLRSGARGEE